MIAQLIFAKQILPTSLYVYYVFIKIVKLKIKQLLRSVFFINKNSLESTYFSVLMYVLSIGFILHSYTYLWNGFPYIYFFMGCCIFSALTLCGCGLQEDHSQDFLIKLRLSSFNIHNLSWLTPGFINNLVMNNVTKQYFKL